MKIKKSDIRLTANPRAVIAQFLHLPGEDRVNRIIGRVERLAPKEVDMLLRQLMADFGHRHRDVNAIFSEHFEKIAAGSPHVRASFSPERRLLLGAFFTKEYSIQSAALFNPSVVPHPDQGGVASGDQRFVMSLRATGEGHISSIAFQTGIFRNNGEIRL